MKDEKANNGPDVNITQMHKDFLDLYDPEYQEELASHENQAYQQGNFEVHDGEFRYLKQITLLSLQSIELQHFFFLNFLAFYIIFISTYLAAFIIFFNLKISLLYCSTMFLLE